MMKNWNFSICFTAEFNLIRPVTLRAENEVSEPWDEWGEKWKDTYSI